MVFFNNMFFNKYNCKPSNLPTSKEKKQKFTIEENLNNETLFVRNANIFFRNFGIIIARYPWISILISTLITLVASSIIPFTEMSNNVSDFTPNEARARKEIMIYNDFFGNKGEPIGIFVLIKAKSNNNSNMLGLPQLEETVKLLNTISTRFKVYNPKNKRNENFLDLCNNFCTINEPIRHFYNGLFIKHSFSSNTKSENIDLSYPITTILGRHLHMDPSFFGVKIFINKKTIDGKTIKKIASVNELHAINGKSIFKKETLQIKDNINEIKMIGLQFRIERPPSISVHQIKKWEKEIVNYLHNEFTSEFIEAFILSEGYLTSEVVRAGLSLLPFLLIGFIIMVIFSCISMNLAAFYVSQSYPHKTILAIIACICPFMACGTSLGLLFWSGFRFGSILCVTPFLILALGVDDAFLMINSWQRFRYNGSVPISVINNINLNKKLNKIEIKKIQQQSVENLLSAVMIDTGASITITTLTNVLAFFIGALTTTPEIQLFSIGNSIAIIIDYIFEWTIFGAAMAIFGHIEFNNNFEGVLVITKDNLSKRVHSIFEKFFKKFINWYCKILTNIYFALIIMCILIMYICISIYGVLNIKPELKPEQLFLKSSDAIKAIDMRNKYIIPFYANCIIFVNNPVNLSNFNQLKKIHSLVSDFESLPSSLGPLSTKFWLRDYEKFMEENFDSDFIQNSFEKESSNNILQFLNLPEFQFWQGFIQIENKTSSLSIIDDHFRKEVQIKKFFFTTASHGTRLNEWSQREKLLNEWRVIADSYSELNVSIYEDDAKFLDLIPTIIPQTLQSSCWTLFCMFLVCLLFIHNPTILSLAIFSIFSTFVGVFGILSLIKIDLDPIVMSSMIMSIGFSVDIPAHLLYHFYRSNFNIINLKSETSIENHLRNCISTIGFPLLEAGISTIICVSSLFFVDLHMARVFSITMMLVVTIGLFHGLLVTPIMFYLLSFLLTSFSNINSSATPKSNSKKNLQFKQINIINEIPDNKKKLSTFSTNSKFNGILTIDIK